MLRLQKSSKDRQISIIMRDKSHLFTHSFLIAFTLAASFHLTFLVLFQITPFKPRFSEMPLSPVHVEADTAFKDTAVVADAERLRPITSGLPPSKPSTPHLPERPSFLTASHMEYIKENSRVNPFSQIEKGVYHPEFIPQNKPPANPIEIVISGMLADKKLIANGLNSQQLPGRAELTMPGFEWRAVYTVLLEGRSGRIFWYDSKQQTNVAVLDRLAEAILRSMRFAPERENFVIAGEVELHFNLETL